MRNQCQKNLRFSGKTVYNVETKEIMKKGKEKVNMRGILKKALSLILVGAITASSFCLPTNVQEVEAASSKAWQKSGGKCYNGKGQVISGAKTRGIDVSEWQGNINWNQVADSNVDFAFIRVGGYGSGDYQRLDKTYEANIRGANEAGLPVGVYYYSTATTTEQAKKDAQWVIEQITGHLISYPVVFDMEDATVEYLTPMRKSQIADAFLSEIKRAGYYPMLYMNTNWYKNEYNMSMLAQYDVWIAQYNSSSTPPDKSSVRYTIWQATDGTDVVGLPRTNGLIKGIPSENAVDLNFGYLYYLSKVTPRTQPLSSYSPDGVKDGWVQENGKYYFYDDGELYRSKLFKVDGHIYYVDENGERQYGWHTINGKRYYFYYRTGYAPSGWIPIKQKYYYFSKPEGWLYTDHLFVSSTGKTIYYADSDGVRVKNKLVSATYKGVKRAYYFGSNYNAVSGWFTYKGGKYYALPTTRGVVRNCIRKIDGKYYGFGTYGRMLTGFQRIDGKLYFFHKTTGAQFRNCTRNWSGKTYVFDKNGVCTVRG